MSRVSPNLTNFTGGELTPLLDGRTDLQKYFNGCRVMENFIALAQGPADRRGGTRFIDAAKFGDKPGRLLDFEFSTEQAYAIEAGDLYFRLFMNKGRLLSGGAPYEISTPYASGDLSGLKWTQSADVMYLVHPRYRPRKLSRTGHTAWTLTAIDFIDGPYLEENTTATTLTPSGTSGTVTLTASAVTGINNDAGFKSTDVGRLIRLKNGSTWGYVKIAAVASATSITATVKNNLGAATATGAWRLGLWSDTTGWPAAVTFHEERLVFGGGTSVRPQRIDGSKTGEFENFTPGTADADAFAYNIGSNKVNKVRWLLSSRTLLGGTPGGEFRVGTDSVNAPLTPSNVQVKFDTKHGCADLTPLEIGNGVVFVQRQGRKLRQLSYNFSDDAYAAPDITLLAEHVSRTGIVDMAYQQEPNGVLWAARADGQLIGCTYLRDQEVTAWHRHPLGDGGQVESLAVIPGAGSDQLWLLVRRTVNGQTVRYVEVLEDPLPLDGAQADAFYVDSGLSYDGAAVTQISGLGHLEGKTVQVLADGALHPDCVVAGGEITLNAPASKVHAGLKYAARVQPMRIEAGSQEGTAQGKKKRIISVTVRLLRSGGGKIGRPNGPMEDILYRTTEDPMDAPPPLASEDKTITFPGTNDTAGDVLLVQDNPAPFTIACLIPRVATNDG